MEIIEPLLYDEEIEILKNEKFMQNIMSFDYEEVIELIQNAWLKADKESFENNMSEDLSDDFIFIIENILNAKRWIKNVCK